MIFVFVFKILVSITENITMKLPVNEAKLTGLWGGNCTTIQPGFDFNICLRPGKVYWSFDKRTPGRLRK